MINRGISEAGRLGFEKPMIEILREFHSTVQRLEPYYHV